MGATSMPYSNTHCRQREKKMVAVVVPLSNRKELTPEEEISLRHLVHFLGKYDKYMVAPSSLDIDYPGFEIKRFPNKFFGSALAHKKLILSPRFYKSFIDYEYILMYQLVCLVFSDQLIQWCETNYDYIGAPWITHENAPYAGLSEFEGKVGNGGFSLRKVESFLKIIYSPRYQIEPAEYWKKSYGSKPKYIQYLNFPKRYLKYIKRFNNARWELSSYANPDDDFWANRANHYYPNFKIAPVETALRFSFECMPRHCFKINNYKLPFGCHAWHKYDRDFWESYLIVV